MAFVDFDDAAIERQVLRRQRHRRSFLRYPYRAVVVLAPARGFPLREYVVVGWTDVAAYHRHVVHVAEFLGRLFGQEHVVAHPVARIFADAETFDGIGRQRRGRLYEILVLGARPLFLRFAVHPYVAVAYCKRVARDGHAAFDVVFAFVHRAADDRVGVVEFAASFFLAERRFVAPQYVVVGYRLVFK